MPFEGQVNYIADLNPVYPQSDDPVSQGDNHIRNIKKAVKDTFPNVDGPVNATDEELNQLAGNNVIGDISDIEGRVSKNEADIAKNAADIKTNSDGIAANAAGIATNAGNIASNDQDIAALDSRIDALENAPAPGLIPHSINDHTDVNTSGVKNGQALIYKDGTWVPVDITGGSSVNFMTQPQMAGDAQLDPKEQTYKLSGFLNGATKTLTVPPGTTFMLEYFFGYSEETLTMNTQNFIIDGKPLHPNGSGESLTWQPGAGVVWPGSEGYIVIPVKESIQVTANESGGYGFGYIALAGMFSENP